MLAVGITEVRGKFGAGDAVEVVDGNGALIAKGQVQVDVDEFHRAADDSALAGLTVIHRDQLVVLAGPRRPRT